MALWDPSSTHLASFLLKSSKTGLESTSLVSYTPFPLSEQLHWRPVALITVSCMQVQATQTFWPGSDPRSRML